MVPCRTWRRRRTGRSVRTQEWPRKYRDQAAEWADKGKETIAQQKENLRSAFEAGRQAYREARKEPEGEPGTGV